VEIKFITLTLQNFKSHRDLTVNFGEETKITGDNAKGKSTIPESISWLLYNTDVLGSKLDPTPITYAADETMVSLLLSVDGKQVLLGRGLNKGKTQYYVNEVPSKAGEFNEILEKLFDKELFFSLFNPNYFFTLHWEKQRAMLLNYVSSPANKEVIKDMLDEQGKYLEKLLKKHSLDDLEKIHKENKNRKDKEYIAAQSKTKTLKEQLNQLTENPIDIESAKAEEAHLLKQIQEIEKVIDGAGDSNKEYDKARSHLLALQDQISMSKERWPLLKNEVIEDTCRTCKRPLDDEAVDAVKADHDKRKEEYKESHSSLVKKRDALKEENTKLDFVDVSEQIEKVRELENQRFPVLNAIRTYSQYENLATQVKSADADENATLHALNDSIFVLDSIKAFRAKEAELQAKKVQALFETLSIRLFKQNKGDGEFKPDFEIEMEGKPYSKLSLSEGIRAGLELREVLSKQSEVITPVFVDNAESITSFKQPSGQLIISRVVAGKELTIEQ
jgi:hypothetical protein